MNRINKITQYTFINTRPLAKCRHSFWMLASRFKRFFKSFLFSFRSIKRGGDSKLIRYFSNQFAVFFSLSLTYMFSFKSKTVIYLRKVLSCIFSSNRIVYPLSFYRFTAMTDRDSCIRQNIVNSTVIDIPKRTKFAIGQRLLDISKVCGIKNIHSFKGFNSFYDFLRKTFFHTRYILVTNKDTIKSNTFVYNLSVKNDESYVVNNGIVHNCRCVVVQVRKDKYPESNERKALNDGSQATAGKHQEMFKFNPGKQMTTFPAYNAYTIRKCKECQLNNQIKLAANIPDNELCAACKLIHKRAEIESIKKASQLAYKWVEEHIQEKGYVLKSLDKNTFELRINRSGLKDVIDHFKTIENKFMIEEMVNALPERKYTHSAKLGEGKKGDPEVIKKNLKKKIKRGVVKYHYYEIEINGEIWELNCEVFKGNYEKPYALKKKKKQS